MPYARDRLPDNGPPHLWVAVEEVRQAVIPLDSLPTAVSRTGAPASEALYRLPVALQTLVWHSGGGERLLKLGACCLRTRSGFPLC